MISSLGLMNLANISVPFLTISESYVKKYLLHSVHLYIYIIYNYIYLFFRLQKSAVKNKRCSWKLKK